MIEPLQTWLTLSSWLLLLILPWLMWPGCNASRKARLLGAFGALALSVLPPLGLFSAMHPILGLSDIGAGKSVIAIFVFFCVWSLLIAVRSNLLIVLMLAVLVTSVSTTHTHQPSDGRPLIASVSLREDPSGAGPPHAELATKLKAFVRDLELRRGPEMIVVWPEWHFEVRSLEDDLELIVRMARPALRGRTVIVGVAARTAQVRRNGALVFSPDSAQFVDQRQPIPFALWRPGFKSHFAARWSQDPIVQIGPNRLLLTFCSEEVSPLWTWGQLAWRKPDFLVIMASHRWTNNDGMEAFTARHGGSTASLFGIPLVRAIHLGPLDASEIVH